MGAKILVVDDEEPARKLLEEILVSAGYLVSFASDGSQVPAAIQAQRPDLILMDIEMRPMDGLTACRRLKENPNTSNLPVIMVTILDESEDIRKALRSGADDYIMKPIQQDELLGKVERALKLAKAGMLPGQMYLEAYKKRAEQGKPHTA